MRYSLNFVEQEFSEVRPEGGQEVRGMNKGRA
jgi:hypothetical protein